jgi:hypothetical protein
MALAGTFLVSACGGGGGSNSTPTNDTAVTPSVAARVNTVINGSTPVPVAFTSSDGKPLSNLSVNIASLPAGWSATAATFTCATVTTGNGCLLNLTFAPTTASTGTLTLGYTYTNNAGVAKTGTVTIPYTSTTNDNVVATPSPAGPVTVIAPSGSQTFSVTFTTDDGNAASNLTLTTPLSSLPAGWSSTVAGLTCASVSTGNGCVLPLTFAPTTSEGGTLTIGFSYASNAGVAKTGSFSIDYTGTIHNHVIGSVSPTPPVTVVVGGSQAVTVNFTIDGGNPATALQITSGLTSLPAGWTQTTNTTPCASVTSTTGCQVQLTYHPTATVTTSGTLALTYSYVDEAGSPQTGSVNVPYASTTNNNATAVAAPASPIATVLNGSQAITVTFTTDDSNPATNLHFTAGLTSLPAGWSTTAPSFTCTTFSSGNGCQLGLTFHPTTITSGAVTLQYAYTDNAAVAKTGSVVLNYSTTTHDNVTGTISPTGQIAVVSGSTNAAITVTFNTDDTNAASLLSINSGLTSLPAGWTVTVGGTTFTCASVPSTGTTCQLGLTYHPTTATPPTSFGLGYTYTDNAGTSGKTGTVTVNYAGTTNNNVNGTASPTATVGTPIVAGTQTSTPVTVTFLTDDANSATSFAVTATGANSLATLPTGWTGPATQTCTTVAATGTGCTLSLTYAPTTATAATSFTLGYSYTSDTSIAKTGSIQVFYSSVAGHIYVADGGAVATTNQVARCAISSSTGVASGCASVFAAANLDPRGVVINGNYAYVSTRAANNVYVCPVNSDGTFGTCAITASGSFLAPQGMAASGSFLYVANTGGTVSLCTISAIDGTLSACAATGTFTTTGQNFQSPAAVVISGGTAYIAEELYDASAAAATADGSIITCTVSGTTGALTACALAATGVGTTGGTLPHNNPDSLVVSGTSLYVGFPGGTGICTMATGNTLTGCTGTGPGNDDHGIAIAPGFAYLSDQVTPELLVCSITSTVISASCTATGSGITAPEGILLY